MYLCIYFLLSWAWSFTGDGIITELVHYSSAIMAFVYM